MSRLFCCFSLAVVLLTGFTACNKEPGVVEEVPMTEAENKENETVGQVPGT